MLLCLNVRVNIVFSSYFKFKWYIGNCIYSFVQVVASIGFNKFVYSLNRLFYYNISPMKQKKGV